MVDLSPTIIARSDQLNSDDLLSGPITVRVTAVVGTSNKEQPIAIHYEGDQGKPYKPGKSMRRVLVAFWDKQGDEYVGKWMTLYRDPNVQFGGIKVGGIRISHMSDVPDDAEMALQVKKGAKALFKVARLNPPKQDGPPPNQRQSPEEWTQQFERDIAAAETRIDMAEVQRRGANAIAKLRTEHPALYDRTCVAVTDRLADFEADDHRQGRTDEQHADQHDGTEE